MEPRPYWMWSDLAIVLMLTGIFLIMFIDSQILRGNPQVGLIISSPTRYLLYYLFTVAAAMMLAVERQVSKNK